MSGWPAIPCTWATTRVDCGFSMCRASCVATCSSRDGRLRTSQPGMRKGHVPNAPLTWGAIYRNGLIYAPDMNSGLWVVKVDGPPSVTP